MTSLGQAARSLAQPCHELNVRPMTLHDTVHVDLRILQSCLDAYGRVAAGHVSDTTLRSCSTTGAATGTSSQGSGTGLSHRDAHDVDRTTSRTTRTSGGAR